MKLVRGFLSTSSNPADKRLYNFRIQNLISSLGLPLFALYVSVNFGHFLWGDFYRIWLWLLSISFLMQAGSLQMLSGIEPQFKLEELQEGFRARLILMLTICLLMFFLPLSPADILVMILFLLFRFAGDSLLAYHSSFGNGTRTLRAELIFWLTILLCMLIFRDSISKAMLMQFVTLASFTRLIAADVFLFKYIAGRGPHSPDIEWFRAALLRFMPVINAFLFFYTDLLLASIILSAIEFSQYHVTMLCILFPVLIYSLFLQSISWNIFSYIFLFTGMFVLAFISYIILTKFAAVPVSGFYFVFAMGIGISSMITARFLRNISQKRNYNKMHLITFGTSLIYLLTFPVVLRTGVLENYLIYETLVSILLSLICWLIARSTINKNVQITS